MKNKKYWIAIPQTVSMQNDYKNGWEIETSTIEKENLILDEFFNTYVKNPDNTEFINFDTNVYNELDKIGVWDTLNQISSGEYIEAYEEGDITNIDELKEVYTYLQSIKEKALSENAKKAIDGMLYLIDKAIKNNVGIYFFF
jgi:hypothetical protein